MRKFKIVIKLYRLYCLAMLCCFVTACASTTKPSSSNFIILDYAEFGPQDIAEELIGPNYWQWDSSQFSKPQNFDIKVIVYREMELDKVKKMFPVSEVGQKDFRYIPYQASVNWYDEKINYLNEELANDLGDKNISFYILRVLYTSSLKIERALRE